MDEKMARCDFTISAEKTVHEEKREKRMIPKAKITIPPQVLNFLQRFIRKNGLAIALVLAFLIQGRVVAAVTERRVTKEVTETVTADLRREFQDYLINQERERQAALALTDEGKREAQITELAGYLSEHAAGLGMDRHVSKEGIMTYLWVDCARLDMNFRGKTDIHGILTDPQQIEHYTEGHATTAEYRAMGETVARQYMTGDWPVGFTTEFLYAKINSDGSVTARNEYQTGSGTDTWRYKE